MQVLALLNVLPGSSDLRTLQGRTASCLLQHSLPSDTGLTLPLGAWKAGDDAAPFLEAGVGWGVAESPLQQSALQAGLPAPP